MIGFNRVQNCFKGFDPAGSRGVHNPSLKGGGYGPSSLGPKPCKSFGPCDEEGKQ